MDRSLIYCESQNATLCIACTKEPSEAAGEFHVFKCKYMINLYDFQPKLLEVQINK